MPLGGDSTSQTSTTRYPSTSPYPLPSMREFYSKNVPIRSGKLEIREAVQAATGGKFQKLLSPAYAVACCSPKEGCTRIFGCKGAVSTDIWSFAQKFGIPTGANYFTWRDTKDESPMIYHKPYRLEPDLQQALEDKISGFVEAGVLEQVNYNPNSMHVSNCFVVPKQHGKFRMVTDLKRVNARLQDLEARFSTTVTTPTTLPMLVLVCNNFLQLTMTKMSSTHCWTDIVLIRSSSPARCQRLLDYIRILLNLVSIDTNDKLVLPTTFLSAFGIMLDANGVPDNVADLRQKLGVINYCRSGYQSNAAEDSISALATPFHALITPGSTRRTKIRWTDELDAAWDRLVTAQSDGWLSPPF
ncbi:hypothetical protein FOL47_002669 [Perkinsus chesapeaki]|uniref:Uncharacterized protein n=1 Tax=Perkinsus chesapeaki TaxID=330153 RepID=A0A7J6MC78_PERCH|nr:hypothetical protein FOL47_002669 [Perkinsus chesapeaki]